MDFKLYVVRAVKSIIYIAVIFLLLLGIIYIFAEKKDPDMSFIDIMIPKHNQMTMLGFILVFGAVYPLITFMSKPVYLVDPFNTYRSEIIKIFTSADYVIVDEKDNKIVFRPKRQFTRFMRMMEDAIEVDYSNNPILIKGMRRDAYRLARHIDYLVSRRADNNE